MQLFMLSNKNRFTAHRAAKIYNDVIKLTIIVQSFKLRYTIKLSNRLTNK